jgi:hypothetical protein
MSRCNIMAALPFQTFQSFQPPPWSSPAARVRKEPGNPALIVPSRASRLVLRPDARQSPIDAFPYPLGELKRLRIIRALGRAEELRCLFLGFQERLGLVEKIFTVLGPLRDPEAHPGNELGGSTTAALSAGYGVVIRPDAQDKDLGYCFTFSAPELEQWHEVS